MCDAEKQIPLPANRNGGDRNDGVVLPPPFDRLTVRLRSLSLPSTCSGTPSESRGVSGVEWRVLTLYYLRVSLPFDRLTALSEVEGKK